MTATGTLWLDSTYFDLVAFLLARGKADESVHAALISALLYVIDGVASEELLQLLLKYGADVNFDNGTALQVAAQNARLDIFEMLLQKSPDSHSLYMALQAASSNGLDEEVVFAFFKLVTSSKSDQAVPDVNNDSNLGVPLIFYTLIHYPTSARLAREVCDLNADLSATTWYMYEDKYEDPVSDRLPPILLALEKNCSDDVIDVLLGHGGESMTFCSHFRANQA
jgi:ankyrin repeat protein